MKTLLILLLAGIQVQVFAQFEEFWPINSEGWITEYNANGPSQANYRFYVEEDTLIGDYTYKVLMRDRINPYTASTTTKLFAYFREEDGVITYYDPITESTYSYFNQNAVVGDTITTYIQPDQQITGCDIYRRYVVDSLSDTTISGVLLQMYFLQPVDYACTDAYAFFWESYVFIETIGFLGYPTPYLNAGAFDGDYPGSLKCYENDELGLVQFITEPCDYLETDIANISPAEINVFPNPTNSVLNISCGVGKLDEIVCINTLGQVMGEMKLSNTSKAISIDVADLTDGIYILQLRAADNFVGQVTFIKQ